MKKIIDLLKCEFLMFKLMISASFFLSIINIFIILICQFLPLLSIIVYEILLNKLAIIDSNTQLNSLILLLVIYLFIQFINFFLNSISEVINNIIKDKLNLSLNLKIMDKLTKSNFDYLENQDNLTSISSAYQSETYIVFNCNWLITTFLSILAFTSSLIYLLKYDYILFIIYTILSIPGIIISYKQKKKMDQYSLTDIPANREKEYYKNILTSKQYSIDIRSNNLINFFKNKYDNLWKTLRKKRKELFIDGYKKGFISLFLETFGFILILLVLVNNLLKGNILFGTFIILNQLIISTAKSFAELVNDFACQFDIVIPRVKLFINFINHSTANENNGIKIDKIYNIEFENISFKYPNTDNYVLNNISFSIQKNEKIALLGLNGAGKSTLVKLLLGFYKPTNGKIKINGVELKNIDINSYYEKIGVCFQDVTKYSLGLFENVYISSLNKSSNNSKIIQSLVDVGLDDLINNYSSKELEKINLTRLFDDKGVELSGGQWQKIMMARVLFKEADLFVLDEPSSALDPLSEDKLFSCINKSFVDSCGIIISHRLSCAKITNKVIVLDKGTHDELMANKKFYYNLYNVQANKYAMENLDNE